MGHEPGRPPTSPAGSEGTADEQPGSLPARPAPVAGSKDKEPKSSGRGNYGSGMSGKLNNRRSVRNPKK
jgi:hypothetical protein